MPRPRGEAEPLPPVCPPVLRHSPVCVSQVCNSNRNCHCDDGWAPPLCEQQGYGGSVDSGPTWNGTSVSLPPGSRDLGRAKPRTRCDMVPACRGRTGTVLCVLTSVCCPQIKTRLSGMDSWSSSSWCCLYSLWVPLFTCAGTTCFGASGCTAGGGHRRTSECDVMVQSPASQGANSFSSKVLFPVEIRTWCFYFEGPLGLAL